MRWVEERSVELGESSVVNVRRDLWKIRRKGERGERKAKLVGVIGKRTRTQTHVEAVVREKPS